MKRDSVRSAVSASTLTNVVTVSIQSSIANSETNALSGKCRKTEEREKSMGRWGERVMGRLGDKVKGRLSDARLLKTFC